jgi:hypothetical protein
MKIDTDHLYHWICAIRESTDPKRTMDAFWKGQIQSKEWLINNLQPYVNVQSSIDIYGGWVGVLASMLFQSNIPITKICNIDIDSSCENISRMMNKQEEIEGRFISVTSDMCDFFGSADIAINTSCEHITQPQYIKWLSNIKNETLIVLQSNNYNIEEHIRIAHDLDMFKNQSNLSKVLYLGEKEFPMYKRFMLIGYK